MPSAAARQIYEDQIPTFMSVFDLETETMADRETFAVVGSKFLDVGSKTSSQQANLQACLAPDQSHKHRDSTSTQTSESDDSSPTTTLSTTDSSPLSDPSPSSSPDSPLNLIPLNNFHSASFSGPSNPVSLLSISEASALERPMTSPAPRKPRNMKGLSIQPPTTATATSKTMVSEPCSPSFIKPTIPAMKRKPSLLSLKTNASDLINKTSLEVPASPGMPPILQRRALKHSTSSPAMQSSSLKTSTFGPAGGMTFPKVFERNESGLSEFLRPMKSSMNLTFDAAIMEEDTPIKTQLASRNDFDEPYREHENNEDQKTPGYPDGPIAIYGDNVYLYLEPTAEEASRFDVVINVAHEVRNPFEARQAQPKPSLHGPSARGKGISSNLSPIPDTAVSSASFSTAWEFQPYDDGPADTPTTPKANLSSAPEYIHIPWDHNTDIAPDLMRLCEVIENRTREGKKVLVHCQQGASRSASLIIAYGLYQNPKFSVNDAYYAAQAKSRWISPNMKLMYSLQDFQKELSKKKRMSPGSGPYRPRTGRSPSKHRLTLSADAIEMASKEPHTAPLPAENGRSRRGSENGTPPNLVPGHSDAPQTVSPGPASAPLTFSWRDSFERSETEQMEPEQKKAKQMEPAIMQPEPSPRQTRLDLFPPPTPSPFRLQAPPLRPKSAQGRMKSSLAPMGGPRLKPTPSYSTLGLRGYSSSLPLQTPSEKAVHFSAIFPDEDVPMSPRNEVMTSNPVRDFPSIAGMRFIERQELTENLFSPRGSAFGRDSFFAFGRPTQTADPRSPPTKGEAPIIRSIDDIL
ncbi:hypothetical protein Trco_000389 [Trichoderma cornu-damae]|uniref:protein-tyrosine-phosphatase n=1 Tax=Trichoderma cornu-damae TaxID=654480 RepID=A0A9P8TYZ2_9HYPO|nr:hypothetical protein Trco_000389 [Trichoderma cornu-damae]